ncbi:MAG: amidophosphoribosyltransferase, partial [Mesorhizobium sp.]
MADADDVLSAEADDHFHDECGVFGIFGRQDAAAIVTLGLHALQHRGQEAAGIVSYDGTQFHVEHHVGLIGDTFTKQRVIDSLQGNRAIGHTRYATTGGAGQRNIQPFFAELADGGFAVAHNGNLTNAMTVQRALQKQGAIFSSTSDTETLLHLVATSRERDLNSRFIDAVRQVEGAFSLVAMTSKKMIGCRDPLGIRPLVLGDLDGAWILASETCALDIIGARFVRDLKPGEMVVVTAKGIESLFPFEPQKTRFCIFEYVYFARPDSSVEGRNV